MMSELTSLTVLVFLTLTCSGEPQLIGPTQPIVATLGDDIILPCHLAPATDLSDFTLEWTRPDLDPRFVLVRRSGQELEGKQHQSFKGRTSLFTNELKNGNVSLKLSNVKIPDGGTYRCFIPEMQKDSFVQLVVAAVSSPEIIIAGLDESSRGVMLDCKSAGWYPEPEVLWLDAEGNLLSAGPTESVRGPDDLYTVSSRVTVEKRHSNSFTCRVQQNNINQTREVHISIADEFFMSPSSSAALIAGLSVSLSVCIVFIIALLSCWWKLRKEVMKTRRSCDEDEGGRERKNLLGGEVEGETTRRQLGQRQTISSSSSANQSSATGHITVEVHRWHKYIRLRNTSHQDEQLGGCRLKLQVNNTETLTYTFKETNTIKAEGKITMWCSGCGSDHPPSGDLVWTELNPWKPEDQLQLSLITQTGEIKLL